MRRLTIIDHRSALSQAGPSAIPKDEAPAAGPIRLALITGGQSPRPQIVADLVAGLPPHVQLREIGALDSVCDADLKTLAPKPGEPSVATRLRDGQPMLVSRAAIYKGIQTLLSTWTPDTFDLAVIFCTGAFSGYPPFASPCRLLQSQPAMDNAVSLLTRAGHRIGVIQPHPRHIGEDLLGLADYQCGICSLDPEIESDWQRVVAESRDCEVLVLNGADYGEEAAERLRSATGLPVILPRRVLASAIRLMLDMSPPRSSAPMELPLELLTRREHQIMWMMVDGLQSKEIARRLSISPRTVSIHRANILAKLKVGNTHMLTRYILGQHRASF